LCHNKAILLETAVVKVEIREIGRMEMNLHAVNLFFANIRKVKISLSFADISPE
jgi:hypothetical protein